MSTKFNKKATRFSALIHNDDTLQLINELAAKLGNRNAVLNDALDIGAPTLYARVFGKEVKTEAAKKTRHDPSVGRELKELRKIIEDIFVELVAVETMLAGLYNTKTDELDGEEVSAESLRDGSICDLPEFIAGLKSDLVKPEVNDEQ